MFATQNDFAPATSQLGHLERVQNPGSFTFSWYPDLDSVTLGIGPTGDYWVSGLQSPQRHARRAGDGERVLGGDPRTGRGARTPHRHRQRPDAGGHRLAHVDARGPPRGPPDARSSTSRRRRADARNRCHEAQVRHRHGHQRRRQHADAASSCSPKARSPRTATRSRRRQRRATRRSASRPVPARCSSARRASGRIGRAQTPAGR